MSHAFALCSPCLPVEQASRCSDARVLKSFNPSTGELLWQGHPGDVDGAVAAARYAFRHWSRRAPEERSEIVNRYANVVRARSTQLATLISNETGKPYWEATNEVAAIVAKVGVSIKAQEERAGQRQVQSGNERHIVRHKPHGVLAVIGPFNFPAHLPSSHIVPSVLAGNTVVFKPSEKTPAVGEFMVDCWIKAGLPEGVLQFLPGMGDRGRALARHNEIDGLLFTGSSSTGLQLHRQFAHAPSKILALEMGGNNPMVVWDLEPEDLQCAASLIVQSAFASAGQRCTSARRLIVRDGQHTTLEDALASHIDAMIVGKPFDTPQPFMGPVIDNEAADNLVTIYKAMIRDGGRPIRTLERLHDELPFLRPGLVDVTEASNRGDDEHFGPLLQLVRVSDFNGALQAANATRYGLTASLIGGDKALYEEFWAETRVGVVNWNLPTGGAPPEAPFGGVGLSGNCRPGGYYAADFCAWPVFSREREFASGIWPA